ncbi:hypothetical protein HOY80DRAFT_1050260 [Tuber brumale]|nr:hypothetical protein HOY80DRAFT_1050260 [Tuber brumale]
MAFVTILITIALLKAFLKYASNSAYKSTFVNRWGGWYAPEDAPDGLLELVSALALDAQTDRNKFVRQFRDPSSYGVQSHNHSHQQSFGQHYVLCL